MGRDRWVCVRGVLGAQGRPVADGAITCMLNGAVVTDQAVYAAVQANGGSGGSVKLRIHFNYTSRRMGGTVTIRASIDKNDVCTSCANSATVLVVSKVNMKRPALPAELALAAVRRMGVDPSAAERAIQDMLQQQGFCNIFLFFQEFK